MKLSINPFLILRIPAFSFEAQIEMVWEDLKLSISQSSPDFYDKIKSIEAEDLPLVEARMKYTLWKYFNRAQYRGTPFGSFAGFAVGKLSHTEDRLIIENKQYLHTFNDWEPNGQTHTVDSDLFRPDRLYFANASIYMTTISIRFLCLQNQSFELAEIERSIFIEMLLDKCKDRVPYSELICFAALQEVERNVLNGILQSLIALQLLFTDLDRNIIGEDYYNRNEIPLQSPGHTYLIAERKVHSGTINKAILQSLPGCVEYLLLAIPPTENKDFNHFKTAFLKRYEYQEIPLMIALDPEFGIGYGDLENAAFTDALINELIAANTGKQAAMSFQQTELTRYLLNCIIESKGDRKQVVELQRIAQEVKTEAFKLPANTFSAMLKLADDLVILEQLGGATANALAGRFTLASKEIERHCHEISKYESEANPDVIFFDVAYMAEGRVDNINRRKAIYDYELPLLNYSCSKNLICLDDLLLTIANDELILLSKKYRKRVVPRLASAYNYNRSDLSVYRFLCDLQHQNIQSRLLFDIETLIPGLNFYPRIQYNNIVISPAKWKIQVSAINIDHLKAEMDRMEVVRHFTAGNGDQTLCFDKESEADMLSFKRYVAQKTDFIITEAFIKAENLVNDVDGKNYCQQFMISLQHSTTLYQAYSPCIVKTKDAIPGVIVPGRDWLYFEIYCHSQRVDEILINALAGFITKYKVAFKCWFFIRYKDPTNHIRIRFQLKDIKKSHLYTSKLMDALEAYFDAGYITDIQIKTYRRELQRYGHAEIEKIEQHFCKDSNYSMDVIGKNLSLNGRYANCMELMKVVINELTLDYKDRLAFVKSIQDAFMKEHHLENSGFKRINKAYESFRNDYNSHWINDDLIIIPDQLLQSFKTTIQHCDSNLKLNLFRDLFHMHVNRLFSEHQRTHEMVIYSYVYKELQREYKGVTSI
ncbi:MAG: thiopeptide-type bacteriocin biosynthesis protein [Candidatus Pedobacter colombiensis]|uniref:Thiopeptide-type bacteriocin biosynthesis protein n=1 Tax=Candidatus Pedobacter colombiensis TaxID=3121371 RepID=A0AAJ5W9Z5_9SPHI|nr:lantibiotic dehydratase [Pedobacter sp.]WEK21533.1 MAG: thiopeptide-type bacteriocin biosynthesis protein [Pedobacter sp.]